MGTIKIWLMLVLRTKEELKHQRFEQKGSESNSIGLTTNFLHNLFFFLPSTLCIQSFI